MESCSPCRAFVIGIAGGSASGKTSVCRRIAAALEDESGVVMLGLDEFYRDLTEQELKDVSKVNFDHPSAFDVDNVLKCLDALKMGKTFEVPIYDFKTCKRDPVRRRHVGPARVVALEGILTLSMMPIVDRCHMKIFVDTDDDVRLARRIKRDSVERGREVASILTQYERFVKPAFDEFVSPSRERADIVLPYLVHNPVGVDAVVVFIRHQLQMTTEDLPLTPLPRSPTQEILQCLRDPELEREDFVFQADRLTRFVVEAALSVIAKWVKDDPCDEDLKLPVRTISWDPSGRVMEAALDQCVHKMERQTLHLHPEAGCCFDVNGLQGTFLILAPVIASSEEVIELLWEVLAPWANLSCNIVVLSLFAAREALMEICEKVGLLFGKVRCVSAQISDVPFDGTGEIKPLPFDEGASETEKPCGLSWKSSLDYAKCYFGSDLDECVDKHDTGKEEEVKAVRVGNLRQADRLF